MLGEMLGEEQGQVTTQRVLPPVHGMPTMEISFDANGKYLGLDANDRGTYTATLRPDGTLFGEGQGVVMTMDGQVATWHGSGLGHMGAGGSVSYRGVIYYRSASPALHRLTQVAAVFEYDVDAQNKTVGKIWEWK